MSACLKHSTVVGCWNKADNTKENVVIHYTYATNASGVEILKATRYTTSDGTPITLGVGDTVTPGVCSVVTNYEIMVVRLDGSLNNVATARPEGIGALVTDAGNTFTIPALGYYGYDLAWLGDTNRGSILEWNGISYRAGLGGGTAGYSFSELPVREFTGELGTHSIVLTAQVGAYLELRFKKPI